MYAAVLESPMPIVTNQDTPPPALIEAAKPAVAPSSLYVSDISFGAGSDRAGLQKTLLHGGALATVREPLTLPALKTSIADLTPDSSKVLLIGENHASYHTRDLLRVNLPALAAKGFTALAVEFPPETKAALDSFQKGALSEDEFATLIKAQQGGFGERTSSAFKRLLEQARTLGMSIIPVDKGNSPSYGSQEEQTLRARVRDGVASEGESTQHFREHVIDRSKVMADEIHSYLKANPTGRVVSLVGSAHLSMDGEKILKPVHYGPVRIPLLDNGTDSALRERGVATTALVVAQGMSQKAGDRDVSAPSLVAEALAVSPNDPALFRPKKAGRPGGVEAIIVLPAVDR